MWLVCLQSVSRGGCWDLATSSEALLQNLGGGPNLWYCCHPLPGPSGSRSRLQPCLVWNSAGSVRNSPGEQVRRAGQQCAGAEEPADPGVVPGGWGGGRVAGGGVLLRRSCPPRDSFPGPEIPGRSESTAFQAPVVVGVHLGDCRDSGLGGLDYQGLGLPLSFPIFTFTLPDICQSQGLWFCRVVPGALVISLGLSFLQPFLRRWGVLALSATSARE